MAMDEDDSEGRRFARVTLRATLKRRWPGDDQISDEDNIQFIDQVNLQNT